MMVREKDIKCVAIDGGAMLLVQGLELTFLVRQAARTVLGIEALHSEDDENAPDNAVSITNEMQSLVSLLRAVSDTAIDHCYKGCKLYIMPDADDIRLVANALSWWQMVKTDFCQRKERKMGNGWGSATNFYTAKWDERNGELLALLDQ